ncbi:hypothetical protein [Janthinobacterium sp. FT14W]|uniref:hypothetical protein n=1 Tax=Janthinobacterium sp. FT14W TaxID=2654253 RepID=UPI00186B015A|nr:hypothetical protein [Janthinobacterium sp. FT14W]
MAAPGAVEEALSIAKPYVAAMTHGKRSKYFMSCSCHFMKLPSCHSAENIAVKTLHEQDSSLIPLENDTKPPPRRNGQCPVRLLADDIDDIDDIRAAGSQRGRC